MLRRINIRLRALRLADLVDDHCVSPALSLLAHPPSRDTAEVVAEWLSLAVRGELVEHQENHGVTAVVDYAENILGWVAGSSRDCGVVSLVGPLPGQPHVVLPQHPVGLEGQLVDVSPHTLIGPVSPVGVAGNMAGEDIATEEVAKVQVSTSNPALYLRTLVEVLDIGRILRSFPCWTEL